MQYKIEVGYKTKRGNFAITMMVEADDEDEALDIARDKIIKGYPDRKWAYSKSR